MVSFSVLSTPPLGGVDKTLSGPIAGMKGGVSGLSDKGHVQQQHIGDDVFSNRLGS